MFRRRENADDEVGTAVDNDVHKTTRPAPTHGRTHGRGLKEGQTEGITQHESPKPVLPSFSSTSLVQYPRSTSYFRARSNSDGEQHNGTVEPCARANESELTVVRQFGLKDAGLLKSQGFIEGKWIDAKDGATIKVTGVSCIPSRLRCC